MRAASGHNNDASKLATRSLADPIIRTLFNITEQSAQGKIAPSSAKKNANSKTTTTIPSRSYSRQRSTSNCSSTDGVCELPQLWRSTSASVSWKSLENNKTPKAKLTSICTSSGRPIKSLQKYSIFEQLDASYPTTKFDVQLPPIRSLATRRSRSNPEPIKTQMVTGSLSVSQDTPTIEQKSYQALADAKNQIVYGYSMSPHPERNGGFRRAHCPIGDMVRDI